MEGLPTCRSGWDARVSSEDFVQCWVLLVDRVKNQDVAVLVVDVQNVRHQYLTQEPEIRDQMFYLMKIAFILFYERCFTLLMV